MAGNYASGRAAGKQPDTCATLSQVASLGVFLFFPTVLPLEFSLSN